jgi:hypothetical protein
VEEEDEVKETSNIMGQTLSDRGETLKDQAKVNKYKQPVNSQKPKEIVRNLAPVNKSSSSTSGTGQFIPSILPANHS